MTTTFKEGFAHEYGPRMLLPRRKPAPPIVPILRAETRGGENGKHYLSNLFELNRKVYVTIDGRNRNVDVVIELAYEVDVYGFELRVPRASNYNPVGEGFVCAFRSAPNADDLAFLDSCSFDQFVAENTSRSEVIPSLLGAFRSAEGVKQADVILQKQHGQVDVAPVKARYVVLRLSAPRNKEASNIAVKYFGLWAAPGSAIARAPCTVSCPDGGTAGQALFDVPRVITRNSLIKDGFAYSTKPGASRNVNVIFALKTRLEVYGFSVLSPLRNFSHPVGAGLIFVSDKQLTSNDLMAFDNFSREQYESSVKANPRQWDMDDRGTVPVAYFECTEEPQSHVIFQQVDFRRTGKYVVLKMLRAVSDDDEKNLDIQYANFWGVPQDKVAVEPGSDEEVYAGDLSDSEYDEQVKLQAAEDNEVTSWSLTGQDHGYLNARKRVLRDRSKATILQLVPDFHMQELLFRDLAISNEVAAVERFLKDCPAVVLNARNQEGDTALFLACKKGLFDVVTKLIESELIDVNLPNFRSMTPLLVATREEHVDIVKILMNADVDLDAVDLLGKSALYHAVELQNADLVAALLNSQSKSKPNVHLVDSTDRLNHSILFKAVRFANPSVVDQFLANPLSQDAQTWGKLDVRHRTVLHMAAKRGDERIFREIITKSKKTSDEPLIDHVYLNTKDSKLQTPLLAAVKRGHTEVVRFLLEECAVNKFDLDKQGRNAVHIAAERGYVETLRLVFTQLALPATVRVTPTIANLPRFLSEEQNSSPVGLGSPTAPAPAAVAAAAPEGAEGDSAAALLPPVPLVDFNSEKMSDADRQDLNAGVKVAAYSTPLHLAAFWGYQDCVQFLVEEANGKSREHINAKDIFGRDAAAVAVAAGKTQVAWFLFVWGRVQTIQNIHKIHVRAYEGNYADVVNILFPPAAPNQKGPVATSLDLNKTVDERNYTALHYAVLGGHRKICEFLVDRGGADVTEKKKAKETLALPGLSGQDDPLLDPTGGAILQEVIGDPNTPIQLAIRNGHKDIVAWLLGDSRDQFGQWTGYESVRQELFENDNLKLRMLVTAMPSVVKNLLNAYRVEHRLVQNGKREVDYRLRELYGHFQTPVHSTPIAIFYQSGSPEIFNNKTLEFLVELKWNRLVANQFMFEGILYTATVVLYVFVFVFYEFATRVDDVQGGQLIDKDLAMIYILAIFAAFQLWIQVLFGVMNNIRRGGWTPVFEKPEAYLTLENKIKKGFKWFGKLGHKCWKHTPFCFFCRKCLKRRKRERAVRDRERAERQQALAAAAAAEAAARQPMLSDGSRTQSNPNASSRSCCPRSFSATCCGGIWRRPRVWRPLCCPRRAVLCPPPFLTRIVHIFEYLICCGCCRRRRTAPTGYGRGFKPNRLSNETLHEPLTQDVELRGHFADSQSDSKGFEEDAAYRGQAENRVERGAVVAYSRAPTALPVAGAGAVEKAGPQGGGHGAGRQTHEQEDEEIRRKTVPQFHIPNFIVGFSAWNIYDLATFSCLLVVCFLGLHSKPFGSVRESPLNAAVALMLPLRYLQLLGVVKSTGVLIALFYHMFLDVLRFLLVFVFFLFGFGFAFQVIMNDAPGYDSVLPAISTMYRLILGDFDFDALGDSKSAWFAHLLFYMFSFLSVIMLLNVLIAMMSSSYERVQSQAEAQALMQRTYTLIRMEASVRDKTRELDWKDLFENPAQTAEEKGKLTDLEDATAAEDEMTPEIFALDKKINSLQDSVCVYMEAVQLSLRTLEDAIIKKPTTNTHQRRPSTVPVPR